MRRLKTLITQRNTTINMKILRQHKALFSADSKVLLERLERLQKQSNKPPLKVIVFGKYNHGKSSFLNAWLRDTIFKAEDVRCTVKVQSHHDVKNNVIWTDTPGLDADKHDDALAKNAIKDADVVLLVHDIISGELDKKELTFIRHYTRHEGKGKLRILLTKIDQATSELNTIQASIEAQIAEFNLPLFAISSTRYQKYLKQNSDLFFNKSGFKPLFPMLRTAMKDKLMLRNTEMMTLCDVLIKNLHTSNLQRISKLNSIQSTLETNTQQFNRAKDRLLNSLH